jgi:di/tricarboxylate transporter
MFVIRVAARRLTIIPIAVPAAAQFGISARPVLTIVMGPAGYRFGDYWKLGPPVIGV